MAADTASTTKGIQAATSTAEDSPSTAAAVGKQAATWLHLPSVVVALQLVLASVQLAFALRS